MPKSKQNMQFNHATNIIKIVTLAGLLAASSVKANAATPKVKARTEKTTKKTTTTSKNKLSTPIKINSQKDIERLFDYALPVIFAELCLEEVPMTHAYDDHGRYKGSPNTVGTGSTSAPTKIANYKDTSAVWYSIRRNPKTFWKRSYSYEEMLQLTIGWAKYRIKTQNPSTGNITKSTTILSRMYTQLKGVSLTPNEFAALFCAVYNAEANITNLLPNIKTNINDKVKCANLLRTWWNTTSHNKGHKTRCMFEALVFLNKDNFCSSMLNMQAKVYKTKKGKWAGASCINATAVERNYCGKTLTASNCTTISNQCKAIYLGQLYNKGGISPAKAMKNLTTYFVTGTTPMAIGNDTKLMTDYLAAITMYNQGQYKQALNAFLSIQKRGGDGPDLLNDIALTYYKLKEYDKCISICKQVLESGHHDEYAKTCYNAGLAYEAKGDYTNALKNYTAATDYFDKYGVADADDDVDYPTVYTNAMQRVQKQIQTTPKTPQKKGGTKKSTMFFLAGMAVSNKNRTTIDTRKRIIKRTRQK